PISDINSLLTRGTLFKEHDLISSLWSCCNSPSCAILLLTTGVTEHGDGIFVIVEELIFGILSTVLSTVEFLIDSVLIDS
ncbi:unnamed protein product, partial [Rotaria magnacalcarata]